MAWPAGTGGVTVPLLKCLHSWSSSVLAVPGSLVRAGACFSSLLRMVVCRMSPAGV